MDILHIILQHFTSFYLLKEGLEPAGTQEPFNPESISLLALKLQAAKE